MTDSLRMEFCRLKGLLEPLQPSQTIQGIKPMTTFVADDSLYVSDQLSNSMQKYSLGETPELIASHGFNGEGANWFANYDSTNSHVWMIGKNENRLLLLDEDLHLMGEYGTPDNKGFFFAHGGEHYLLSGFLGSNRLYRLEREHFVACDTQLPRGIGSDYLVGRHVGGDVLFFYLDSKIVLRFTGDRFVRIAQLNNLPGRMYGIDIIEHLGHYVVLSVFGKSSALYLYTKNFECTHCLLLDQAACPGSFGVQELNIYIASRQKGYVNKYTLEPRAIIGGLHER